MNEKYDIDLTDLAKKNLNKNWRKIGRYGASDISAILNGWITPQEFLNPKPREIEEYITMADGTARHNLIEDIIKTEDYEIEAKKEYNCGDFVLVHKADFIKDTFLYEIKTSKKLYDKAKSWHIEQTRLGLHIHGKELGIIQQPVIDKGRLILITLGTTKPNDEWFNMVIGKVGEFDKKLKELN